MFCPLCPQDTQLFISSFHSEASLKRADYTAQDFSLQERVRAQVWRCSYPLWTAEVLPTSPCAYVCIPPSRFSASRSTLQHPRHLLRNASRRSIGNAAARQGAEGGAEAARDCKSLKNIWLQCCHELFQLLSVSTLQEKTKGAKEKVILSAATQRSLDRKKR